MTPEQQQYVTTRLMHIRWWNRLGWLFVVVIAAFYAWLWQHKPLYIDPGLLLTKLQMGQVSDIEIAKLAALGNLAFIGCGLLFIGIVVLTYVALWTEKQTISILTTKQIIPFSTETTEASSNDDTKTH
ncbi:hypothetical protein [Agitococcus lubricus]|uniref:Uncharacterized protein n=1 Tax=Agitococcus lubricus TaxID=1077255 RepID=A0A2T5J0S2_9GAMM|nr:hypothetical protein [Agitococcus lubricus]PTQ89985.1 hypothetical protein C8N29_10423 [Agitococcus lubricus]